MFFLLLEKKTSKINRLKTSKKSISTSFWVPAAPERWSESREGVIIECPLNDLFHDVVTAILASQMGISEMVMNVGNVVTMMYGIIRSRQTVISRKNHDF